MKDFTDMVLRFDEAYYEGIADLITQEAKKYKNTGQDFERKILHFYLLQYLHRHAPFQPAVRRFLKSKFSEEFSNAGENSAQLAKLMELLCAFEPASPSETLECLKQAYLLTHQRVAFQAHHQGLLCAVAEKHN